MQLHLDDLALRYEAEAAAIAASADEARAALGALLADLHDVVVARTTTSQPSTPGPSLVAPVPAFAASDCDDAPLWKS